MNETLENTPDAPEKKNISDTEGPDSAPHKDSLFTGEKVLTVLLIAFGVALAVPVLGFYLITSPLPDQSPGIFGLPYDDFLFAFFISAAALVCGALYFIRLKAPVVIAVLVIGVFACLAPVIGLVKDLTLQQIIFDVPTFTWLPFFLKPANILIQFLLPVGIVAFLFLQIKSFLFSKRKTYVFVVGAVYLLAAASIGFTTLIKIGEPNLVTVVVNKVREKNNHQAVAPPLPVEDHQAWTDNSLETTEAEPVGEDVVVPEIPGSAIEPDLEIPPTAPLAVIEDLPEGAEPRKNVMPAAPEQVKSPFDLPGAVGSPKPVSAPEAVAVSAGLVEVENRLAVLEGDMAQILVLLEKLNAATIEQSRVNREAAGCPADATCDHEKSAARQPEKKADVDSDLAEITRQIKVLSERLDKLSGVPATE